MQGKQQTSIERQPQNLALEAIERVVGGFSPEEESQHDIADLNNSDQSDGALDPPIIPDYIYFGHDDAQEVLDALAEVEDGVVQEEAHAAPV